MDRRRFMTLSGALALAGCGAFGEDDVEYPDRGGPIATEGAPSVQELWGLLPDPVRKTLTTHPAFTRFPEVGLQTAASRETMWDDRFPDLNYLNVQSFAQVETCVGYTASDVSPTGAASSGEVGLFICGGAYNAASATSQQIINNRTGTFRRSATSRIGRLSSINQVRGSLAPFKAGNEFYFRFDHEDLGADRMPQGTATERELGLTMLELAPARKLWHDILLGNMRLDGVSDYLLDEPSFLMGEHFITKSAFGTQAQWLYSALYGLRIMEKDPSSASFVGEPWIGRKSRTRLAGEGLELNDVGKRRFAAAIAALEHEVKSLSWAGERISADARTRSQATIAEGVGLYRSGNFGLAQSKLEEALDVLPSHGLGHFYLAATLGKAASSQSVWQRWAARRLERYHLMAAAELGPATPEGEQARNMLQSAKI
jgi:hypothetical protein